MSALWQPELACGRKVRTCCGVMGMALSLACLGGGDENTAGVFSNCTGDTCACNSCARGWERKRLCKNFSAFSKSAKGPCSWEDNAGFEETCGGLSSLVGDDDDCWAVVTEEKGAAGWVCFWTAVLRLLCMAVGPFFTFKNCLIPVIAAETVRFSSTKGGGVLIFPSLCGDLVGEFC